MIARCLPACLDSVLRQGVVRRELKVSACHSLLVSMGLGCRRGWPTAGGAGYFWRQWHSGADEMSNQFKQWREEAVAFRKLLCNSGGQLLPSAPRPPAKGGSCFLIFFFFSAGV